jgi:hypothetical protein
MPRGGQRISIGESSFSTVRNIAARWDLKGAIILRMSATGRLESTAAALRGGKAIPQPLCCTLLLQRTNGMIARQSVRILTNEPTDNRVNR